MNRRVGGVCVALLAGAAFVSRAGAATSGSAQFLNISTRGFVQSSDQVLIGGFIVTDSVPKRVLLRGLGPSLSDAGISSPLADPLLELRDQNGNAVFTNNNWRDSQEAEIRSTGLPPRDDREAAIVRDLVAPGRYTAILRSANTAGGVALIEVYDLNANAGSLLANISTREFVDAGERAMIGGFIVGGGSDNARLIARGIGPSLANNGVIDAFSDPTLELHASNGALITANDNWKETQQSAIEATGIAPTNDLESAIVVDLPPAGYTTILRGRAGTSGTALVELYDLNTVHSRTEAFSFESGLEGWTPKATDVSAPPIPWSVTPSQDQAAQGTTSLKYDVSNFTDAAKVWVERPFSVSANRPYHVTVQFSFATADYGDANRWTIIAGVRTLPADTRSDLTYQDDTWNGFGSDVGCKWLEKSYGFDVTATGDGLLYVDVGVWGTWEGRRVYYVDNVRVTITER